RGAGRRVAGPGAVSGGGAGPWRWPTGRRRQGRAGFAGRAGGSAKGVASHTFTVPLTEALARRRPSGLNHTPETATVCTWERSSWPVCASHTFTSPRSRVPPGSPEALARRRPWRRGQTAVVEGGAGGPGRGG